MELSESELLRPFNIFAARCPSRKVFDQVFSRWGILVLGQLSYGAQRFGALRRSIDGISEKMLSQTLKTLEDEGLVNRLEWNEKLPHVEYSLSESGQKIAQSIGLLIGDLYSVMEDRRNKETPKNPAL